MVGGELLEDEIEDHCCLGPTNIRRSYYRMLRRLTKSLLVDRSYMIMYCIRTQFVYLLLLACIASITLLRYRKIAQQSYLQTKSGISLVLSRRCWVDGGGCLVGGCTPDCEDLFEWVRCLGV
jgi:hypothetical protein